MCKYRDQLHRREVTMDGDATLNEKSFVIGNGRRFVILQHTCMGLCLDFGLYCLAVKRISGQLPSFHA